MMNQLLQQVRILDPVYHTDKIADVLIENDVIVSVEEQIKQTEENTIIKDCKGLILGPGLVDLYSHSGEPGFEERETLSSLIQASRNGGFTRINILPDTNPPIDNIGAIASLKSSVNKLSFPHNIKVNFWANLTLGGKGEIMTELMELYQGDIIGFTEGKSLSNLGLLRRILEYLEPINKPIALYPCINELAGNGVMREGKDSMRLGLPGINNIAETAGLAGILEIVKEINTPVHIMGISTKRSVEIIADAKGRKLPITASTIWLNLLCNTGDISSYNPNLKLNPPLGNPEDQKALIEGIKTGVIDAIAINHTPLTYEEKTVSFTESPPGAIGLEIALPLLWQNLVETGEISALELWRSLSTKPAECLQQKPSIISPGNQAEVILFNPNETWKVNRENIKSLSTNTHYWQEEIKGKIYII
ncbi:MAG TPA: dihydroorotase [Allocoleopsis sp.]